MYWGLGKGGGETDLPVDILSRGFDVAGFAMDAAVRTFALVVIQR